MLELYRSSADNNLYESDSSDIVLGVIMFIVDHPWCERRLNQR